VFKVVLDTNQFVSGLLIPHGPSGRLLEAWRAHAYLVVISQDIQRELERVLTYPRIRHKYSLKPDDIDALRDLINREAIVISDPPLLNVVKADPDDNKILACAVEAGADYLVTGDQHLLAIRQYEGVEIVTVRYFLARCLRQ